MEHPGDCLSNTEAHEGRKLYQILILVRYAHQTQDNEVGDAGDDWVLPPSPPPEDRLPKRSKLDDLVEVEFAIKPLGFSSTRTFNPNSHPPPPPHRGFPQHDSDFSRAQLMEQAARLARLERTKAETAAIIAAAAAAHKEAEERVLVEAAAAAEEQTKEEERNAERERRRKERKERERGEKKRHHDPDQEDNREKRLLKLVGAVVVKTMSKYRTRMDVDTFKKHAKEVRGIPPLPLELFSLTWLGWFTAHTYHCGKGEKVVELQGQ
jgi:hypothetical protein